MITNWLGMSLGIWNLKLKKNKLYIVLSVDDKGTKEIITDPFMGEHVNLIYNVRKKGFRYESQRVKFDPQTRKIIQPKLI